MNAVLPAPIRVLVAEDNEDHRFLTVRALRQAGGDGVTVEAVSSAYRLGSNSFVTKPAGTAILQRLLAVGEYWLGGTASLPDAPQ